MEILYLLIRFLFSFLTAFIIVKYIYFPKRRNSEYLFTFLIFNALIFFICFFLKTISMNIGFAFGLFAIFSILRYRTETIPIREMTYQFLAITVGAINGLADLDVLDLKLIGADLLIIALVFLLDRVFFVSSECSQLIRYEKIELIKPSEHDAMISDLKERTGLDIYKVDVEKIDFLRDTADLNVFYRK